jgi:hypothetical protein
MDWVLGEAWKERQLGGSWRKSFESFGVAQVNWRGHERTRSAMLVEPQLSRDPFSQMSCINSNVSVDLVAVTLVKLVL